MSEPNTRKPSRSNWALVDTLTDEEIDYSDDAPASSEELLRAQLRQPKAAPAAQLPVTPERGGTA